MSNRHHHARHHGVSFALNADTRIPVPPHVLDALAAELRMLMAARLAGYVAGAISAVASGPAARAAA